MRPLTLVSRFGDTIGSAAYSCLVEAAVAARFRVHVQQVVALRRVPPSARPLAVLALGIGVRTSGARLEVGPEGRDNGGSWVPVVILLVGHEHGKPECGTCSLDEAVSGFLRQPESSERSADCHKGCMATLRTSARAGTDASASHTRTSLHVKVSCNQQ